ncbi:K(+)-transporting ATPase subunit F [Escherichia coli]|nr:K(+)-transporting ATPase subunit F [Escherichia coli]
MSAGVITGVLLVFFLLGYLVYALMMINAEAF